MATLTQSGRLAQVMFVIQSEETNSLLAIRRMWVICTFVCPDSDLFAENRLPVCPVCMIRIVCFGKSLSYRFYKSFEIEDLFYFSVETDIYY